MKSWILLFTAGLMITNANAMGKKPAEPDPAVSPSPAPSALPTQTIDLTPDNLRQYVLAGNETIEAELFNVYTAKDNKNVSVGKLLPGVNLSSAMGGVSSFVLSNVTFLLPFLIPDNWINLKESEHQLNAEELTYQIVELNQFASAYALYETIVDEYDALDVLNDNYHTLYQLYLTLAAENQQTGTVNMDDVKTALERSQQAWGAVISAKVIIDTDTDTLRQAMGYGIGTHLTFSKRVHTPSSAVESQDSAVVSKDALAVAPEAKQLSEVLAAAGDAKWSAIFGFISGATLGPSSSGGSADFSKMSGTGSVSFSFSQFPAIQLTQDTIDSIQNQLNDVGTTLDEETDTALKSIVAYNQLVQTYAAAAKTSYEVYLSRSQSYSLGTETIEDVLQAESDFYTSSGQRVLAQTQLDQARINLHRIMLTDQFDPKNISGCAQNVALSGGDSGPFGWINDIFHPSADRVTLDQMCKGPLPPPSPAGIELN